MHFLLKFISLADVCTLHGPSMFAVKAKIYGVLYNQASQSLSMKHLVIGQRQKGPDFSAFHWSAFRNHQGSTFTEKDRNKLNYRIGPLRSDSVIELISDLITE